MEIILFCRISWMNPGKSKRLTGILVCLSRDEGLLGCYKWEKELSS